MEDSLGYAIFPTGWVVLVVGSIWLWVKSRSITGSSKVFLTISLISFYMLGYTSTVYWLGFSWEVGVIPVYLLFLVLFILLIKTVITSEE